jgi:hypothetical protein
MSQSTTVRIEADHVEQADALIPLIARDPALKALGRDVGRSTVIRLALSLGLAELKRRGGVVRDTTEGEQP